VLALVPTVLTTTDRARGRRRTYAVLLTTLAVCTGLVSVGVFVWKFRNLRSGRESGLSLTAGLELLSDPMPDQATST